jgi:transcription elongation factor Elf1
MDYNAGLNFRKRLLHSLSVPFIYGALIGFVVLDVLLELYHRTSFPLYGLQYVKRRRYIRIDRHRLKYLGVRQRFNCLYCGYASGVIAYAREITAITEKYWCGIKHKNDPGALFHAPDYHKDFLPYGNRHAFQEKMNEYENRD